MTRQEKDQFIDSIAEKLKASKNLYLADISGLTVSDSNELRKSPSRLGNPPGPLLGFPFNELYKSFLINKSCSLSVM